ncbi:MAG: NYN domain-containing protein [Hyphomicrobiaceae bacterium]
MFRRKIRSVLLVDFDNIAAQLGHADFVDSIPRWLAWLEDGRFDPRNGKRSFIVKRMYWNTYAELYRRAVEAQKFEAFLCPSKVKGKKSLADMVIAVDALRAAYESKRMQECIVLAVDTDFEPLLDALNDCSTRTVIAASPGIAMEVFSECADVVIPLDALRQAMAYERPRSVLEVLRDKLRVWRRLRFRKDRQLALAARHLAAIGRQQPSQAIAKKRVMQVMEEKLRLKQRGPDAYLSCGNYDTMLEQIAAQSDELALHEYDERRRAIAWRPPRPRTQPTLRTAGLGAHGRRR